MDQIFGINNISFIDLPFDINIIFFIMSTQFDFYAISNAKFVLIIYFILLKMYHEITKNYKDKVEITGTYGL